MQLSEQLDAGDCLAALATLLEFVPSAAEHPGLWEMVARRASDMGASSVVQQIQMRLWETGIRTTDIALDLARYARSVNKLARTRYFIEHGIGPKPEDPEARLLLARAVVRDDPDRALVLLDDLPSDDLEALVLRLDALRGVDRLDEARALVHEVPHDQQSDPRVAIRAARISEALSHWDEALDILDALTRAADAEMAASAHVRRTRLLLRLDRRDAARAQAAVALSGALDPLTRLDLLTLVGADRAAALHVENLVGTPWLSTGQNQARLARKLRDLGRLGMIVWLMKRRALDLVQDIPAATLAVVPASALSEIGARDPVSAFELSSDQLLFPIPIGALLDMQTVVPKLDHGVDHLLVNATLAAGGAERQFVFLAKALSTRFGDARTSVALFSQNRDRGHMHFRSEIDALDLPVHVLSSRPSDSMDVPASVQHWVALLPQPLRSDVTRLLRLCLTLQPRVLHGWQDRSSFAVGVVGSLLGVANVILSVRNMQPERRGAQTGYAQRILQYLARLPNVQLTANSQAGARDYEAWLSLAPGEFKLLSNALDETRFALAAPPSLGRWRGARRPVRVGGVFRLALNKRPDLWLQTVAALRDRWPHGAVPRLVGNGPLLVPMQNLAERLNLGALEVRRNLQDPREIYGGIDLLLLMSSVEGIPNVVLEAQLMGLPVVACNVGGTAEAVASGPGAGLLLDGAVTPDDAACQIASWLPGAQGRKASRARRTFTQDRFGQAAFDDRLSALYEAR